MITEYQQVVFMSGPFAGLLGKTLTKSGEFENWYVQIMIAGNPVIQEVPPEDIQPIYPSTDDIKR